MTIEEAIAELKEDIALYIPTSGTIEEVDRELPDGRLITALEMAIKALEQKPCEDCISRQAAVDALKENKEMINALLDSLTLDYNSRRNQEQRRGQIDEDIEAIKALPSVTPQPTRWIPVSERLPEEFQRVLVTIVNYKGDKVVRVAEYYNRKGIGVFRIKENHEMWEVGEEGLLAWMPLPEPYKADREEGE